MISRRGIACGATFLLSFAVASPAQQHEHQHEHDANAHDHAQSPAATATVADGSSESEHAPPDPPANPLPPMSHEASMRLMDMDDRARFGRITLDQFERRAAEGRDLLAWEAWASYGSDLDKAWLKTEGRRSGGATHDARVEALWDHVVARWWSAQAGLRHDFGRDGSREWFAIGVQGLAPGFFETELTAYLRSDRVALRTSIEYDLLLGQRLVLQPAIDAQAISDSGVSDAALGLRLRYEIRREFAPYVGARWEHRFDGGNRREWQALAGLRAWW